MSKNKSTISAGEINKYIYCPYQWYYNRIHGAKHIRELYRARNRHLGYEDSSLANISNGLRYHSSYQSKERMKRILRTALFAILLASILYSLLRIFEIWKF